MRRGFWAATSVLFLTAGCPSSESFPSEPVEIARAQRLARHDSVRPWPAADANLPVILYVDRSQSMRGFLNPEFPAKVATDYRSVLDGFDARLRPARVFGFGNEVRPAGGDGIGVLGNADFYSDGNTELERVFPLVEADSALAASHIIIGDGRRTDPNIANDQFVRMRRLAARWIDAGGTLVVAASAAPFRPVPDDPATCRGGGEDTAQTCPLYAFAFVARGDERRVTAALADVFQHLYVLPLPALPASASAMVRASEAGMALEPAWAQAPDGTPIARLRAPAATNVPLHARLSLGDTTSRTGRAMWSALRGRRLVPRLSVRALEEDTAASAWRLSPQKGALVRGTADPFVYQLFSRGPDARRNLYRIELHPAGDPSWLDAFDADDARDRVRTYGLGRLFESFRAADPASNPPAARAYVVVN